MVEEQLVWLRIARETMDEVLAGTLGQEPVPALADVRPACELEIATMASRNSRQRH